MIDIEKNRQKLSRLEAHVAWVRQNLDDRHSLDQHLAEISKIKGIVAAAASTKCQLVQRPE